MDRERLLKRSKAELVQLLLDALIAQNSLEDDRQRQLRRMEEAIDNLSDAFVLYDADGNLVLANSKFKKYYSFNAHLLVPGTSFETLFRNEVKEGLHPGVTLDDEAFIAQRVADFFEGQVSATRSYTNDRWMLVTDRKTPSGEIVGLRTDITELKEREKDAIRAENVARLARLEAEKAKHAAERQARTDVLTGLNNRLAFFEYAKVIDGQARRYDHPYVFAMIDIDHFKSINDTWGHKAGDTALETVSSVISKTLRETDILGRIGGEEFAVMLPETVIQDGELLAERVRLAIEETAIQTLKGEIKLTVSIGIAELDEPDEPLEKVVANADTALYQAKNGGRNKVECYTG